MVVWCACLGSYMSGLRTKIQNLSDDAKAKIQELEKASQLPLKERRVLYNALARRFKYPEGLRPGLLEKYQACLGNQGQRFQLLKAFLLDENMRLGLQ